MNLKEVKAKIEANEHVNYRELADIIAAEIETARFMVPLCRVMMVMIPGVAVCSGDERDLVECKVDETRYKLSENYKIGFTPVEFGVPYGKETFYLSDFSQLLCSGHIKIV